MNKIKSKIDMYSSALAISKSTCKAPTGYVLLPRSRMARNKTKQQQNRTLLFQFTVIFR